MYRVLLAALLVVSGVAEARMHTPYRGHRITPASGAIDGIAAPASTAYSFRKLRAAYTGAPVRLRRASDNAESDIGFTGSGDFDTASATTFCAATSCFTKIWYDQSGGGRDAVQATLANQPAQVFNCNGVLPCMQTTTTQNVASVSAALVPVLPTSFSAVANRNTGGGACSWPGQFNSNYLRSAAANTWQLYGSLAINAAAADNAWHAGAGVINGASSVLRIDATETPGTVTGLTVAGQFVAFWGAASTTCSATEIITWDGYALTAGERTALTANQKAYWIPQALGVANPSGAYSFRKVVPGYPGKAVQLRRASDNAVLDIGFTAGGDFDTAAATTHCAATSCFGSIWYDQSSAARNYVQTTLAGQLAFVFNCAGTLPCFRNSVGVASQVLYPSAAMTPSSAVSMSAVGNRNVNAAGNTVCVWFGQAAGNGNRLSTFAAPWYLAAGTILAASPQPADNAWHSQQGVIAGAASVFSVDGVEVTGTIASDTTSGIGVIGTNAAPATTCSFAEAIIWDGYALTAGERTALTANQRAYWGF